MGRPSPKNTISGFITPWIIDDEEAVETVLPSVAVGTPFSPRSGRQCGQ